MKFSRSISVRLIFLLRIVRQVLLIAVFALVGLVVFLSLGGSNTNLDSFNLDFVTPGILVVIIGLLIAILLLPSLTKVKVGQIELDAAPISRKRIELEPILLLPSPKSVQTLKTIPDKLRLVPVLEFGNIKITK